MTIAQQIKWNFEANGRLVIDDKNGKQIYYEDSSGYWAKSEYDSQGKSIYYKNSDGFWAKSEYDSKCNLIYYENSNGIIMDNRPKPCEDKVIEIESVKYKLIKL